MVQIKKRSRLLSGLALFIFLAKRIFKKQKSHPMDGYSGKIIPINIEKQQSIKGAQSEVSDSTKETVEKFKKAQGE